ncbi:hypothetical protein [Anabaena azotica]|nr:hypothetical protein [Anabaena azotica]
MVLTNLYQRSLCFPARLQKLVAIAIVLMLSNSAAFADTQNHRLF